jgi:hypothetical protein
VEYGYVEGLNARLRDEPLSAGVFHTLAEARILTKQWRRHSSLGYRPPAPGHGWARSSAGRWRTSPPPATRGAGYWKWSAGTNERVGEVWAREGVGMECRSWLAPAAVERAAERQRPAERKRLRLGREMRM